VPSARAGLELNVEGMMRYDGTGSYDLPLEARSDVAVRDARVN
jgi:hypothetical protein